MTATLCTPSTASTRSRTTGISARAANSATGAAITQTRMTRGSKEPSVRVAQPMSRSSPTTTNQLEMTSPASARRLVPFGGVPGKVSENTISARIRYGPSNVFPNAKADNSSAPIAARGSSVACTRAAGASRWSRIGRWDGCAASKVGTGSRKRYWWRRYWWRLCALAIYSWQSDGAKPCSGTIRSDSHNTVAPYCKRCGHDELAPKNYFHGRCLSRVPGIAASHASRNCLPAQREQRVLATGRAFADRHSRRVAGDFAGGTREGSARTNNGLPRELRAPNHFRQFTFM